MSLFKNETESVSKSNQSMSSLRWMMPMMQSNSKLLDFERQFAFSRVPGQPKQYVQDLVRRDAAKVFDLWQKKGGYIYICGKVQMAEEVSKAVLDILKHLGNMDQELAEATLQGMRKLKRYQEDIFG